MDLEGRVAIVTGGGRGIGREEALTLASYGAAVVVNDLGAGFSGEGADEGPAHEVAEEIRAKGGKAVANTANVTDHQAMKETVEQAVREFGRLDIVVNNAGILRDKMIFSMEESMWDAVMAVHLKGTYNLTHHACVYWRDQAKAGEEVTGRVINTSSDAGLLGNVGQANYAAAKAGIAAFTIVVGMEMQKYGVKANAIAPIARTRLTTDATPAMAAFMGQKPKEGEFDKLGPQNIAPVVAYLASKECVLNTEVLRVAGDLVWLMQGWHSVNKISSNKQIWKLDELANRVENELLKDRPAKETIQSPIMEIMQG
ncbi:MAG: SDR family NAD(P)-dependent oxidoreductase [Candidatus Dadabacteria bacterium]|nr:MAG: SDR family NAD(P)-dependent oxidoreductase [Candidatus Dadabacteria bacterium]